MDKVEGFQALLVFHSFLGVSYFGLFQNYCLKFFTLIVNISFIAALILFSSPCFFNCNYDIKALFEEGSFPKVLIFLIHQIKVIQAVACDVTLIIRSSRVFRFVKRASTFIKNFDIELLASQKQALNSTVALIVFYNLVLLVTEGCFLCFLVPKKLAYIPETINNKTAADLTNESKTLVKNFDPQVFFYFALVIRTIAVVHSKAIQTVLIYFAKFLAQMLQRLEIRFDKFLHVSKGRRSIEVAKVAFIELQNLIKEADEVFLTSFYDPFLVELCILFGSLLILSISAQSLEVPFYDNLHELLNAFASFITLALGCSYGDEMEREMEEVIQSIAYINSEKFDEVDYRSVSVTL